MREPFCDHGGERGTGRSGPREEAARDSRHRRPGARHSARQPRPPCGSHGACWPRRPVAGACPKATAQGRQLGLGQREGGLGDRPPWPRCGHRQDEARVDAAEPRPSGAARAGRVSRFQRHSLRPQQPLCLLITWLAPHSAGLGHKTRPPQGGGQRRGLWGHLGHWAWGGPLEGPPSGLVEGVCTRHTRGARGREEDGTHRLAATSQAAGLGFDFLLPVEALRVLELRHALPDGHLGAATIQVVQVGPGLL